MSTIIDDPSAAIAARVRAERAGRDWSLADLAAEFGVSKAMLSKIEREEASPTATVLARIAGAFGLTLAALVGPMPAKPRQVLPAAEQPRWQDPATGYIRRQIFQSAVSPLELAEIELPAGAEVAFPAGVYALAGRIVWVTAGRLEITENGERFALKQGDRLELGPPGDTAFRNRGDRPCRYLLAQLRL